MASVGSLRSSLSIGFIDEKPAARFGSGLPVVFVLFIVLLDSVWYDIHEITVSGW